MQMLQRLWQPCLVSSLALSISDDIPFNGPIAGVQVGYVNGE